MEMFNQDPKNYHVWSYRHWLVRRFKLWDDPREMADVETLINEDVRNNSAWNHRFVLRFGPRDDAVPDAGMPNGHVSASSSSLGKGKLSFVDEDLVDSELEYIKQKIVLVPENRSPWAYARGVFRAAGRPISEWLVFADRFTTISDDGAAAQVKSSHALEWLADVYGGQDAGGGGDEEKKDKDEAVRMLTLLKEKYDPIRRNYWDYRIALLA